MENGKFPKVQGISYLSRYDVMCKRLVAKKLYTATAVVAVPNESHDVGNYENLSPETSIKTFLTRLLAHCEVVAEINRQKDQQWNTSHKLHSLFHKTSGQRRQRQPKKSTNSVWRIFRREWPWGSLRTSCTRLGSKWIHWRKFSKWGHASSTNSPFVILLPYTPDYWPEVQFEV